VNITTKAPRDSLGGFFRATAGELNTRSMDLRVALKLGDGWYAKALAGSATRATSRSRAIPTRNRFRSIPSTACSSVSSTACPPRSRSSSTSKTRSASRGLRVDKYLQDDSLLSFEAGYSTISGPVFQTGIGRVQNLDSNRPFYRFGYASKHWNVLGHYSSRDGDQANLVQALVVNYQLKTQETRYGVEAQGNWNFDGTKGRFVIGAAYTRENVNSINEDTGKQTVIWEPVTTNREALFTQVDWSANKYLKLVFAGRVDWSTLHKAYFSPKAALVYNINSTNSLRITYNRRSRSPTTPSSSCTPPFRTSRSGGSSARSVSRRSSTSRSIAGSTTSSSRSWRWATTTSSWKKPRRSSSATAGCSGTRSS
jgi:hypothetical protein